MKSPKIDLSNLYSRLGLVYRMLNNTTKAIDYFNRAKALRIKEMGNDHPDIGIILV